MRSRAQIAGVVAEIAAVVTVTAWATVHNLAGLAAAGHDIPVGPDAGLWGLAGLDAGAGNPTSVPPLFPALLAFARNRAGELGVLQVAPLAAALVPGVVYAGVRAAGGGLAGAMVAAALCLGSADLYGLSLQLQPEAVTALAFALGAGALAAYGARPSAGRTTAVIAAATVATLSREHGIIVAVLGALALSLWPAPGLTGRRRWMAPAALGLALAATPVALGWTHAPPWDWPWGGKGEVPLHDLAAVWKGPQSERPVYVRDSVVEEAGPGIDRTAAEAVVGTYPSALALPDRAARFSRILRLNAWWAWAIGAGIYRWLGLGLVGATLAVVLRRRPAMLASPALLSAVLPLWVVWSQRRHVAVLLPVGAVGLGLGWGALGAWIAAHRPQRILWIAGLVATVWTARELVAVGRVDEVRWERFLHAQADRDRELVAAGQSLKARSAPGDALCADPSYLASVQLLQFASGLPYVSLGPDLLTQSLRTPDPGWRCYLIVRAELVPTETVAPGWERVLDLPHRAVFRYKPDTTGPWRAREEGDGAARLSYQGAARGG